jgi:hypothetical protein
MRAELSLITLAILLASAPAAAELWKWTDSSGQTHYSDTPPSNVKASKVGGGVSVVPAPEKEAPAAPATREIRQLVPSEPVAAPTQAESTAAERKAKRARLIERCEKDRGVDCEESVDAMLDGPLPSGNLNYDQPVWVVPRPVRPPHRPPHQPVKPKPLPEEPYMPMGPFPKPVKPK